MPAVLTEEEFSKHVNTKFHTLDAGTELDLELAEVKGYRHKATEHEGMERFSVYFKGPEAPLLPQKTYTLQHAQMGEFEIFLVPISPNDQGSRYEAVFNYFK